jgi:hypothetical protein
LHASISGLPGDARFSVHVRYFYLSDNGANASASSTLRVDQAVIEKTFARIPLQLQAGRFPDLYDPYGGYWDGVLARFGRPGLGGGFAIGFEPARANEALSVAEPRGSVFLDYRHDGPAFGYALETSFGASRPSLAPLERSFAWSQRIRWRGLFLTQRTRWLHADPASPWSLEQIDATAHLAITPTFAIRARYDDRAFDPLAAANSFVPRRRQIGAGLVYSGNVASFATDATLVRWTGDAPAQSVSSSLFIHRTPLLGIGLSASGSLWSDPDGTTVFVAPGLHRDFGPAATNLLYRHYRVDRKVVPDGNSDAVEAGVRLSLSSGFDLSLRGVLQRDPFGDAKSVQIGVWRSF